MLVLVVLVIFQAPLLSLHNQRATVCPLFKVMLAERLFPLHIAAVEVAGINVLLFPAFRVLMRILVSTLVSTLHIAELNISKR